MKALGQFPSPSRDVLALVVMVVVMRMPVRQRLCNLLVVSGEVVMVVVVRLVCLQRR